MPNAYSYAPMRTHTHALLAPRETLALYHKSDTLSSCEAEIRATNATSKKVVDFRHLCTSSMCKAGHCLPDATQPTLLYNDNDACVKWSHNMTSKAACQIEIRENSVREWVQDKSLAVKHVAGNINPSDIFTKEMRDGTHFRRLRDSFMSRYQALGRGNGDFLPPNPSSLEPCL
jgi:hypothetical protein